MFRIYCPKANSVPKGLQLEGLASTWSLDNPQILEKHYSLSDSFYWWDATVWEFHTKKVNIQETEPLYHQSDSSTCTAITPSKTLKTN